MREPFKQLPVPDAAKGFCAIVANWAQGQALIVKIYLYGSRLHGTERSDSDIDLAIVVPVAEVGFAFALRIQEFPAWCEDLTKLLNIPVHLELAHAKDSPRVWGYLKEKGGALIYQKSVS